MPSSRDLPFPIEEFQKRLIGVQRRLKDRELDVLLCYTPENIYYLTGYHTTGYYVYQCLIVPADQDPIMVTRELEEENVIHGTCINHYSTFEDTEDPVEATCKTLAEYGLSDKRLGFESTSWFLQLKDYEKTVSLLPSAKIGDGADLIEASRVIKSQLEIECMREAAVIVEKGMKAGIDASRPGVTDNQVAGELTKVLYSSGSLYFAGQPYVAAGVRSARGHATFSNVMLEEGDPVFFEISANVKRYSTALMRTINLGQPDDEVKRVAEASIAGVTAAIEAMRPGATSGEVDDACRTAITRAGYGDLFNHRTGYSIGIGFPPGWGEGQIMDIKPNDPRPLEAGMTFHLTPALFIPDVAGPGFSETVLVTESGAEPLTTFPREFIIK